MSNNNNNKSVGSGDDNSHENMFCFVCSVQRYVHTVLEVSNVTALHKWHLLTYWEQ